jgi:hypothetical protein
LSKDERGQGEDPEKITNEEQSAKISSSPKVIIIVIALSRGQTR